MAGHRLGSSGSLVERLVDLQQQLVGRFRVGELLPVDDAVDEVDRVVVAGKRQQDPAIEDRLAALVDEFRLETDRRLIRQDLHVVVGDPAQQRPGRDIVQLGHVRRIGVAFLGQLGAEVGNAGIFDPGREIEQHRIGPEIGQGVGIEVLDRGEVAIFQQAGPMIVGAHLHAALVRADRCGRIFAPGLVLVDIGLHAAIQRIGVVSKIAPKRIHGVVPPVRSFAGVVPDHGKQAVKCERVCVPPPPGPGAA